jgi:CelD/BcsL family acetyltransferase involved in cellulose biosynthesis
VAERINDVGQFIRQLEALGPDAILTPFQAPHWLESWFRTLGPAKAAEPVLVVVRDGASGQLAMALPLMLHRVRGLRVIGFADLSVTDYGFPILGPAAPGTPEAAAAAFEAVLACLPDADLVQLQRLPEHVNGTLNPLGLLPTRRASSVRNVVELPPSWEAYLNARSKSFRKCYRQKRRALEQAGPVQFRVITEEREAHDVLAQLEVFQRERLRDLREAYTLDQPPFSRFYHDVLSRGVASRFVLVTALEVEDTMVAASYSLLHQSTCTMTRLSHRAGPWVRHSPSFLLACETIRWLIEHGVRTFDFGLGRHAFKQHFGCEVVPLLNHVRPKTVRGQVAEAALQIRDLFVTGGAVPAQRRRMAEVAAAAFSAG